MAKRNKEISTQELASGQVSILTANAKDIPATFPKMADVLTAIQQAPDARTAIEIIVDKTPDGKAALNIYQRLANQGKLK